MLSSTQGQNDGGLSELDSEHFLSDLTLMCEKGTEQAPCKATDNKFFVGFGDENSINWSWTGPAVLYPYFQIAFLLYLIFMW
jgi:hypothetical protein